MKKFLKRFGHLITGTLACFDRLLLRGSIRQLGYEDGLASWMSWKGILLKDFAERTEQFTARLKKHAQDYAARAGRPYKYLESPSESKEKLVEELLAKDKVTDGLVCVLSAVELGKSYEIRRNRDTKHLELRRKTRPCQFFYFYFIDREFGLMHVRLQSWLPFDIQICLNGREWLARLMDKEGLSYDRRDNCFASLQDPKRAQELADSMLDTDWVKVCNHFAKRVNPLLQDILKESNYYWTVRQGEYATDVMFRDAEALAEVYPHLVHHATTSFGSEKVMRFLGQKLHGNFTGEVTTRPTRRPEGVCVKHTVCENSIKMYDKQGSVLRIETTINNARRFKVRRRLVRNGKQVVGWYPMRKGVIDMRRRVELSRAANARYLKALATIPESRPAHKTLDPVSVPVITPTQRYRALRPISTEDAILFASVMRGEFILNGFRNAEIRALLFPQPTEDPREKRRRGSRITRLLRLLSAHGLVQKLQGTSRYLVTTRGVEVMSTALHVRTADVTGPRKKRA